MDRPKKTIRSSTIRRSQVPPFYELDYETFQCMCRDLFDAETSISTCDTYGVTGEKQFGIDLIARRKDGDGIEVGQCKCCEDFPPSEIRDVTQEFFKHWNTRWSTRKVKRFVLFVACDLSKKNRQDEISKQEAVFNEKGIKYEVWSAVQIQNKLSPYPAIVNRYFEDGKYWVNRICGLSTPSLGDGSAGKQSFAIDTALESQLSHLSSQLETDKANQLEGMRREWREGHKSEALSWIHDTKDRNWTYLSPNLKADILLFEARICLEDGVGGIEKARVLADEALVHNPSQDQVRTRSLIACCENEHEIALQLLDGRQDIDSVNLKAAILLDLGRVDESLALLDFKDDSDGTA